MRLIKKDVSNINVSDYRVEYYGEEDCQTRGGWQCYCEFYCVYEGSKLIAEIDEEHGQLWINGRSCDFSRNNTVDRIELLRITNDEILVYYPYNDKKYEFDFNELAKKNDQECDYTFEEGDD